MSKSKFNSEKMLSKFEGEEIKSGDVVKLKSGGPMMTISFENESARRCTCQWFEGKNLLEAFFDKTALIKVEGK